ncbi:hypothetical protein KEM52_001409 [Ascosphaera acerosa]|nr:hypothetical protein KEM52_001409 [Ascosphaera acerosa]
MVSSRIFNLLLLAAAATARTVCHVTPSGSESVDDAPAIVKAFKDCKHNGRVVFDNSTYHIRSVMSTTGLDDVEVDLKGTLLWSKDVSYWLKHSLDVGYQNQSTAWILGGKKIAFDGHGYGTIDGNGWEWYKRHLGSNYPGRPHALTVKGTQQSTFHGLRFMRSQMWTLSVIDSEDVLFRDIYVNNLDEKGGHSSNTDGANTMFSNNITFDNWEVINGDDCISTKADSIDIKITNSVLRQGLGIAIGSIGQYKGVTENVEGLHVDNVTFVGTTHAVYFKTWTGESVGVPPNGGGGGRGHSPGAAFNNFTNLHLDRVASTPFTISQCTTFDRSSPNCTSSRFHIRDNTFENITGTLAKDVVARSMANV